MGIVAASVLIVILCIGIILYRVAWRDFEINRELDRYEEMIVNDENYWKKP
jgi:hypothetical protein